MTTTATHNADDTTTERVLFMAFALSEKTWKLGFTTGHGQKPRERGVAARSKKWLRPKNALVCLKARRWCVVMKPVVKASGCIAFCKLKGSATTWWLGMENALGWGRLTPQHASDAEGRNVNLKYTSA